MMVSYCIENRDGSLRDLPRRFRQVLAIDCGHFACRDRPPVFCFVGFIKYLLLAKGPTCVMYDTCQHYSGRQKHIGRAMAASFTCTVELISLVQECLKSVKAGRIGVGNKQYTPMTTLSVHGLGVSLRAYSAAPSWIERKNRRQHDAY